MRRQNLHRLRLVVVFVLVSGQCMVVLQAETCTDVEPPKITCPNDLTLLGKDPVLPNAKVFRIQVSDDCISVNLTQTPRPGSTLKNAATPYTVTVTAMDKTGKKASCDWMVSAPEIESEAPARAKIARGKTSWTVETDPQQDVGYAVGIKYRLLNGSLKGGSIKFFAYVNGVWSDTIVHDSGTDASNPIRGYFDHPIPFTTGDAVDIVMHGTGVRGANVARVTLLVQYI